jgi:hypothetical protein
VPLIAAGIVPGAVAAGAHEFAGLARAAVGAGRKGLAGHKLLELAATLFADVFVDGHVDDSLTAEAA